MKILFVTETAPFPPDSGGKIRTYNVLKALSKDHEITMICGIDSKVISISKGQIEGTCDHIRMIPLGRRWTREIRGVLLAIRKKIPHLVARHYCEAIARSIKKLDISKFDAVHFDHLDATAYYELFPKNTPFFLDEHNIVTVQVESFLKSLASNFRRTYIRRQLRSLKEYESEMASRMKACFVCSEEDKDRLQKISPNARIYVAPNGVDLDYYVTDQRKLSDDGKESIVFVGSMDYVPNIAGIEWFSQYVWPKVKRQFPELKLYIIGKNPPMNLVSKLSSDRSIIFTGKVSDVRPYYYRSIVSIVPLLSGSGTRLKILEAMACGVPVVSTTIGAEGIGAINEKHLAIADKPKEFIVKIIELIENPRKRASLTSEASYLVKTKFSWSTTLSLIRDAYARLEKASQ